MVRSKEDLSERQENLERLKQQHGIEWWDGGVCLVQLGYPLQTSSCRLSNMVSGVGFLAFIVFLLLYFLFYSYGFRGSSTHEGLSTGKTPVVVSGNDTEWMNGLSRIPILVSLLISNIISIVRLSVVMHHDPEPYVQRPNNIQQDPKPWQDLQCRIYWQFLLDLSIAYL